MERTAAPLRKHDLIRCNIDGFGMDAEGVCHVGEDGLAVFVPGAIPGEDAMVRIVKVEKRHAFGRVEELLVPSPDRAFPPCPVYKRCGGCVAQHMTYARTLAFKRDQVRDCLQRIGGITVDVPPVLGAKEPWHCRNKASFPVVGTPDAPKIGFYASRSHEVVDSPTGCLVQDQASDAAISTVRAWMTRQHIAPYEESTHSGLLRHVMTRTMRSGAVMVVLVCRTATLPHADALVAALRAQVPGLASVMVNVNDRRTNVILGTQLVPLWGAEALEETLHGLRFRVSAHSFFQVNTAQAEVLYQRVLEDAALTGRELVVDAYCGAGTISLLLAQQAARVIGMEIVPQAVADARHNAQINDIGHAEFLLGAAEELLPKLVADGLTPDVVVVDPPRKGCDSALLHAIVQAAPKRVVYVSCNPATLARDAAILAAGGYMITRVQSVDMFCWAGDVETVLLLTQAAKKVVAG